MVSLLQALVGSKQKCLSTQLNIHAQSIVYLIYLVMLEVYIASSQTLGTSSLQPLLSFSGRCWISTSNPAYFRLRMKQAQFQQEKTPLMMSEIIISKHRFERILLEEPSVMKEEESIWSVHKLELRKSQISLLSSESN